MLLKLIFLNIFICHATSYKIFVLYPFPVKSLNILGEGLVKHLLSADHEVTYASVFPIKTLSHKNLRQIDISSNLKLLDYDNGLNITHVMVYPDEGYGVKGLQEFALYTALLTFENENLINFLSDTQERFDAVIVDLYETEMFSALSSLYECPMIWAYSMGAHWQVLRLIDQPTNPAYTSDYLSANIPPLTFTQRIQELWSQLYWSGLKRFLTQPKEKSGYEKFFEPLFRKRGRALPGYEDVIYNVSLILANEHLASGKNPSTPQNFKFVGGYHIETPTKPLSKDFKSLMDNAEHGVIYFSLGSLVKSKDIPKQVTEALVKMFGELKQTVIWKYEANLVNLPKNLHIINWAPQQSILAHPKCLLFITHGGHLSSIEAIHFGVPIIGVPVFIDQFLNIQKAVARGYGLKVDLTFDLAKQLKSAIKVVLDDNKYRARVKELSAIYHDRPIPPGKELVHWVEHAVKTRGAPHLRSPALLVPWHQKMYLDLAAMIAVTVAFSHIILKLLLYRKHKNSIRHKKDKKL